MNLVVDKKFQLKLRQATERSGLSEQDVMFRALDMFLVQDHAQVHEQVEPRDEAQDWQDLGFDTWRRSPDERVSSHSRTTHMRRGELWLVKVPPRGGHGQHGTRPALLVSDVEGGMVAAVPCTSNVTTLSRFPRTVEVRPTRRNGLSATSVLLITQLISIDVQFLLHKIGTIERSTLSLVNKELRGYFCMVV